MFTPDEYERGYRHCREDFQEQLNDLNNRLNNLILIMNARERVAEQSKKQV